MEQELSKMYAVGTYLARKNRVPKWIKYATRAYCQECFALQHEQYGPDERLAFTRSPATVRRTISGGPDLILCGRHSQLWRERDAVDLGRTD